MLAAMDSDATLLRHARPVMATLRGEDRLTAEAMMLEWMQRLAGRGELLRRYARAPARLDAVLAEPGSEGVEDATRAVQDRQRALVGI